MEQKNCYVSENPKCFLTIFNSKIFESWEIASQHLYSNSNKVIVSF